MLNTKHEIGSKLAASATFYVELLNNHSKDGRAVNFQPQHRLGDLDDYNVDLEAKLIFFCRFLCDIIPKTISKSCLSFFCSSGDRSGVAANTVWPL